MSFNEVVRRVQTLRNLELWQKQALLYGRSPMQKKIYSFLVLVLASAVVGSPQGKNSSAKAHEEANTQQQKTETFKLSRIGEKMGADGAHLAFRTFEGSSGSIVVVTYGTLASSDKATAELRLWSQTAKRVEQDEQKKDSSGQVIGQRVVATFVGQKDNEYTAILWTNGADCFRIQAPSLGVALHFEERVNKGVDLTDE